MAAIQNMFAEALRLHQAGRPDQAAQLYRRILDTDPANPAALYLLGMVALSQGQAEAAIALTRKAIAANGHEADYHFQLGAGLQMLGDLEAAIASYRHALALKPGNADTHTNMGNALAGLGRLDEAAESLARALALSPGSAISHCSLGALQWRRGRRDEAESSFRKAVALQPDYAAAIINLGNIHRDKGELGEAEKFHRRAVGLAPQSADAHGSLGVVLWNLGRSDEALACYRQALNCDPRHVESLANLALARWELGALDEAEEFFSRASSLRPDDPDLLNNFAGLLMARGKYGAAMEMVRRSLASRETGRAKRLFASLVRQGNWNSVSEEIRAALVRALTEPWDRPGNLARAAAQFVKFNPAIGPLVARAHAAWPKRLSETELLGEAGFAPLAEDALLLALLTSAPNSDIPMEHFLTMARAALLAVRHGVADETMLRFAAALAQQCFINEFIFLPDDAELEEANKARAELAEALVNDEPVTAMHVLAVAAYFPLRSLALCEKLPAQSWPAPVEAVLTQQIREPAQEERLRASVPRLTAIRHEVSRLVQRQYEENPYPRWVRLPPERGDNVIAFLSAKFPAAQFERIPGRSMQDFLVAGCGTGQQSIALAQKFGASHLLAVDLSLASLCYARRKSDELGLAIEYGQADILELASLGRQFDVVDCSGVLHHMADPYAGWRALVGLLRPGGFMKLGFYSQAARRPIAQVRARIAELGISAKALSQYRQELMESDDAQIQRAILNSEDFFTTSACRDLLFHVQEHHLTLAEIRSFLESQMLRFLGFELDDAVLDAYHKRFPDDVAGTNLVHWETFEAEHPALFARMYEFWVWKAP